MTYEEELVTNKLGRQYWIYKDDKFYHQRIANVGPYQLYNLKRLRELVPCPRTIVDAGMNIGMNTIEYATWGQTIHGFEPTPQTYDIAIRNIQMAVDQNELKSFWWPGSSGKVTGEIIPHNCGLGQERLTTEIVIKPNNAGHNYVDNSTILTVDGRSRRVTERITEKIDIYTLDSFSLVDVDIIKIDVEGYELPVIIGGEHTITRDRPVVQVEMVETQARRFGYVCQDIYDWFIDRDYIITLSDGTDAGKAWRHFPRKMDRFFVPEEKVKSVQTALVSI